MSRQSLIDMATSDMDEATVAEISSVYGDQPVFPERVVVEEPSSSDRRFPGWSEPVLVLAHENQGVCSWGLALEGPAAGKVLVGGELHSGQATRTHSATLAEFIAARKWDGRCLARSPFLQAQAAPLDDATLLRLRGDLTESISTHWWPCERNLRFERGSIMLMLWLCEEQCDWCVSGSDTELRAILPYLRELSDLRTSLWSDDERGIQLLAEPG